LAIGQAPADLDGPVKRLIWLGDILPEVVSQGADLLLLPELFACGYNIGADVLQLAETADGPTANRIAQLARVHGVAVHYGFAERDQTRIFNAALCIGPDGATLGRHRKLLLPPGFEREHFTPGTGCTLFEYCGLKFATLICYDAEFPETVRHAALQGADVVLVPTALGSEWNWVAHSMIPTRAFENGVYLGYANYAGRQNDLTFLGHSVIAAPDGTEAARAGANPGIMFADLHKDLIAAARSRLPYLRDQGAIRFR
jgi:nitrilase